MRILIMSAIVFFGTCCMAQENKERKVSGDFDGNGTKEFAYTQVSDCTEECDGKYDTTIFFNDKNLSTFVISPANQGALYNVGDLNNDGKDEIGFYPNWCTSCWHSFYVYTFTGTGWKPLVDPIPTHCSQWEEDQFPVKRDPEKKGHVIITSSEWKDDDIKIISKSVKID